MGYILLAVAGIVFGYLLRQHGFRSGLRVGHQLGRIHAEEEAQAKAAKGESTSVKLGAVMRYSMRLDGWQVELKEPMVITHNLGSRDVQVRFADDEGVPVRPGWFEATTRNTITIANLDPETRRVEVFA